MLVFDGFDRESAGPVRATVAAHAWKGLPAAFALPAAYGDLVAAVLAMVALLALRSRLGLQGPGDVLILGGSRRAQRKQCGEPEAESRE